MALIANGCTKQKCAKAAGRVPVVGPVVEQADVGSVGENDDESDDAEDEGMEGVEEGELTWLSIEGRAVDFDGGGWPVFPKLTDKKALGRLQVVNGRGVYVTCFRTPADDGKHAGKTYKFRDLWKLTDGAAPIADALLYAKLCNANLGTLTINGELKGSTVVGVLHVDGYTGSGHPASSSRASSGTAVPAKRRGTGKAKGWVYISEDNEVGSDGSEYDPETDTKAPKRRRRAGRS